MPTLCDGPKMRCVLPDEPITRREISYAEPVCGNQLVADEGELLPVGGPGGHIDSSLAAEELGEHGDLLVLERHEAQFNVLVGRMAGDALVVSEEDHRLAVGREVREPVVAVVAGDLFLIGAVRLHAPDLHVSGALGVEVNVCAVGRVLGAVVEAGGGGEARFVAARDGDGVDVEVAVALAGEGESLAVGRPAVPVRGSIRRDQARRAAGDGNNVDAGLVIVAGLVADGEELAVGRDAVIVVAMDLRRGGDDVGLAAVEGETAKGSILIEDEELAVAGPVGRFEVRGGDVFDVAIG